MNIILLTKADFFEGETDIVNKQFSDGLQRLHLRKPMATKEELKAWIEDIRLPYRKRIVLHDHHDLAQEYGLGGIHLNRRNAEVPDWFSGNSFSLSRSCHTISEITAHQDGFDYVFLSPIFDSISKEGYHSAFSKEELLEAKKKGILSKNVYALGGITFDKLNEIQNLGFYGAAILGAFWNNELQTNRHIIW
ncbi:MAG: thiamine phosphate synthase [Bacteroidaceae bacterium]|nr:thiamine phosphate synthase [Bacteroidaceae bacterium]